MLLKENYIEFQREIERRQITQLIHFTPTINLLSILDHGRIFCRQALEALNMEESDVLDYAEFTDTVRYDDKSYINLSISFPNAFLLRRFMEKTAAKQHVVWSVLKIHPKYIYHRDTLFSVTNAANAHNKKTYKITGDLQKFNMMFEDNLQIVSAGSARKLSRTNLRLQYPTDVQSEVLVKDSIPAADILHVCFKNNADLAATKAALTDFDTSVTSHMLWRIAFFVS